MPPTAKSPPDPRFAVPDARFILGIVDASTMPPSELPEVAFAGRSNVGKSSLLNALTSRKGLARTSSTPGCTRQINVFDVRLGDGLRMRLVDLPGFGYAKRSKQERVQWGDLIEAYLQGGALSALVLLVDVRRGLQDEELQLVEFLRVIRGPDFPCLIVMTKVDKVSRSEMTKALDAAKRALGRKAIGFSATTSQGRELLWTEVRRWVAAHQLHAGSPAESAPSPPPEPSPVRRAPSSHRRGPRRL